MEKPPSDPLCDLVPGYPKLAGQMGILPEAAMFRTFSALNARNLLYLQAELVSLEKELIECEAQDNKHYEKRRYALDWFWLNQSQWEEGDAKQYQLVQNMKRKLKEYSIFRTPTLLTFLANMCGR